MREARVNGDATVPAPVKVLGDPLRLVTVNLEGGVVVVVVLVVVVVVGAAVVVVVVVGATVVVVVVIVGAAVVVVMVIQFLLSTLKLLAIGVAVFGKFSRLTIALYILGDVPISSLKYNCLLLMIKYAASVPRNLKA
jgi:hypothetical protein